jgi:hypothetical protein
MYVFHPVVAVQLFTLSAMRFVDDFWDSEGRSLRKPDLICLRQDHELYKTAIFQPSGKIEFDNDGIRFSDIELAIVKFRRFLDLALSEEADLAIAPEYSCPIDSVTDLLHAEKFPSAGKLWVIGCQSITANQLLALKATFDQQVWIFETDLVGHNRTGFFDPVFLMFRTHDTDDRERKVVVVQFKTCCFGGDGFTWERDNMVKGSLFYVIDNAVNSTKLISLICSDTLGDTYDFPHLDNARFLNAPLLIVHIQLNAFPFDATYKTYRNLLFQSGKDSNNKEVICVNWGRGVTYMQGSSEIVFNQYGGSAWYAKTTQANLDDSRINKNHSNGLYYTRWHQRRTHVNFFNYCEHVFLLRSTKPSQEASHPQMHLRSGTEVLSALVWVDSAWQSVPQADDGFRTLCAKIEAQYGDMPYLTSEPNRIAIERMIELTSGGMNGGDDWHTVSKLASFQVDDSEINSRNTFTQDPTTHAASEREQKLIQYATLRNSILPRYTDRLQLFPNPDLIYDPSATTIQSYLLNLWSQNDMRGVAVYLRGEQMLENVLSLKARIESLFPENHESKRIFIWWRDANGERLESNAGIKPSIKDTSNTLQSGSYKRKRPRNGNQ